MSESCKQSTLLWSGSITNGGTATLNDSFRNYKKVVMEFAISNNNLALALAEISTVLVRGSDFAYYFSWVASSISDTSNSATIKFMNNTTIKVDSAYGRGSWNSPPYLKRVYGIN